MTQADLGLALIVLGVVVVYAAYVFAFPLRRERRKTQRYALFASRHRIVMLVADGRIEEDDEVFQFLYRSVNYLIPHAKHMGRWEIVRAAVASPIARLADEGFREHLLEMLSHEDEEVRTTTREFLLILQEKLAKIWSVRIAMRLTSWGLDLCVRAIQKLQPAAIGSDAMCLYRAVDETNAQLATA